MMAFSLVLPLGPARKLTLAVRSEARVLAVMGRSGSGKTSLLNALAGLHPGARGRIELGGRLLQDDAQKVHLPPEARGMGYVPQDALLFPHLSVEANVHFGVNPRAHDAPAQVAQALALAEVGHLLGRYPATLSGGEKQRVALARALATRPRLLLLDEPLSALDAELKERILPSLERVRQCTELDMVYVTHRREEAERLADALLVLDDSGTGRVTPLR